MQQVVDSYGTRFAVALCGSGRVSVILNEQIKFQFQKEVYIALEGPMESNDGLLHSVCMPSFTCNYLQCDSRETPARQRFFSVGAPASTSSPSDDNRDVDEHEVHRMIHFEINNSSIILLSQHFSVVWLFT